MLKSLLWKNKHSEPVIEEKRYSEISADFSLNKLYAIMSNEPKIKMTSEIFLGSLTSDYENIKYRQFILADFLKRDNITEKLGNLLILLDRMAEMHKILKPEMIVPKLILRLKKLELYHSIMVALEEIFTKSEKGNYSEDFIKIGEIISNINKKNKIPKLIEDIDAVKKILAKIKSIDIGINIDHQYEAREAIILSINDYSYKKSNIIDKLLCSDENERRRLSIASEIDVRSAGGLHSFNNNLNIEFATLLRNEFSEIEDILSEYNVILTSKVLDYRNEICLYYGAVKLHEFLLKLNCNSCLPSISSKLDIYEMYSFVMAYEKNIAGETEKYRIVKNNIEMDETESACIITGANEGGKTVLLSSIATSQLLFQNGLIVPAGSARIPVYEKIFSHFPKDEDLLFGTGRLGEEAVRINAILEKANEKTLVLMNEPFITTSPTEGLEILIMSIKKFCKNKVNLFLVTHYLDIIQGIGNEFPIASYVMEYENGIRTYRALKKMPMAESHAIDIAKNHGIDKVGILNLIKDRMQGSKGGVES